MLTERTRAEARAKADELRRRGDLETAAVLETVLREADAGPERLDVLTTTQAADLFGVTGQTIKNWVRAGRLPGYRIGGRIMIPAAAVAEYVRPRADLARPRRSPRRGSRPARRRRPPLMAGTPRSVQEDAPLIAVLDTSVLMSQHRHWLYLAAAAGEYIDVWSTFIVNERSSWQS